MKTQQPNTDYRTHPEDTDTMSFFIFGNLRCQQDHEGDVVYRCDTIQEATTLFQHIQSEHPSWTIALGGSLHGMREIDFVQRRNGSNCLITDYQHIDFWKDRPDVKEAIETAMVRLGVEWQADHELTGCSILVPHEFDEPPLERYLADKVLRPTNPDNVLTSIQEVYDGEGWMSLQELKERTKNLGYESDDYPKVTRLNVAYRVPDRLNTGYVDIAPSDFRIMKQAYLEASKEKEQPKEVTEDVKTIEGWHVFAENTHEHHLDAYLQKGDPVGQDIVDYFVNMLPPATNREHLVQIGSPYDSKMGEDGKLHPTFATFAKEDGTWRYAGHCFRGETKEPEEREKSVDDLAKLAKERATEKNAAREADAKTAKAPDLER